MLRDKRKKGFTDDIDYLIWKRWHIGLTEMEYPGRVTSLNTGQSWNDEFSIDYVDLGCADVHLAVGYVSGETYLEIIHTSMATDTAEMIQGEWAEEEQSSSKIGLWGRPTMKDGWLSKYDTNA